VDNSEFDPFEGLDDIERVSNSNSIMQYEDQEQGDNQEGLHDDSDSDFLVDKENEVDDIDVDMSDFTLFIDQDA